MLVPARLCENRGLSLDGSSISSFKSLWRSIPQFNAKTSCKDICKGAPWYAPIHTFPGWSGDYGSVLVEDWCQDHRWPSKKHCVKAGTGLSIFFSIDIEPSVKGDRSRSTLPKATVYIKHHVTIFNRTWILRTAITHLVWIAVVARSLSSCFYMPSGLNWTK